MGNSWFFRAGRFVQALPLEHPINYCAFCSRNLRGL
jgi:hypothetical protein